MQQDLVEKIKNNPKYHELISKRSAFAWVLSILVCIIYYGFILVVAFNRQLLGTPIAEGSITTIGIPVGIFVIVSSFVLTGIYVWRANSTFDELTRQIKQEVK
jgi:uncharacterized membrane protein (DUF485 family)